MPPPSPPPALCLPGQLASQQHGAASSCRRSLTRDGRPTPVMTAQHRPAGRVGLAA
jgi:hypothetical protein